MNLYQETTNWDKAPTTPNWCYVFADRVSNKVQGFAHSPEGEIHWFSRPLQFDSRGRTFQRIATINQGV